MTQLERENQIRRYQKAYYDGEPLISDEMFDELWDELAKDYPDSELLKKVGEDTIKGKKIKHWMTMGSQAKFNTEEGLRDWLKKESIQFPIIIEDKIDGNSMSLQYRDGKLLHGVTRGNSEYGECADRAVFNIPSIPKEINEKGDIAVRGEVVMNKSVFEEKYSKDFANPRNLTAGLIKNEDFNHYEDLRFIAYDTNVFFTNELEKHAWLVNQKFDTVPARTVFNIEDLLTYRNQRNPRDREYAIDGLILRQNTIDPEDATKIRPSKIHAFKWEDESAETTLREIEWSMTGNTLTPVAIFDPCDLEGTTVKRASLANPSYIFDMNLKIGDIIEVRKHGQIIPHVEGVIEHCGTEEIEIPKTCPVCGKPLVMRDNNTRLYCENENCRTQIAARLAKYLLVLDVKGFGPALQDYVNYECEIDCMLELYTPRMVDYICNNYGSVNAKKAFKDLFEKSKNITLEQYIAAFNIGNVGIDMAKTIVNAGFDTWDKILNITKSDLIKIDGWSDIRADKFLSLFEGQKFDMTKLINEGYVTFKESKKVVSGKSLNICVTGKLEHFTRKSVEEFIENNGCKVVGSVTSKTDYLVTNDTESGSSKNVAAKKLGIKIISENDLISLFN